MPSAVLPTNSAQWDSHEPVRETPACPGGGGTAPSAAVAAPRSRLLLAGA